MNETLLNSKYQEIFKLAEMLIKNRIPGSLTRLMDGWKVEVLEDNITIGDFIEHCGSYGAEEDTLESMGFGLDDCKGHLTAEEAFKMVVDYFNPKPEPEKSEIDVLALLEKASFFLSVYPKDKKGLFSGELTIKRRGKWIFRELNDEEMLHCYECSECEYTTKPLDKYTPFCPNCGAEMEPTIYFDEETDEPEEYERDGTPTIEL